MLPLCPYGQPADQGIGTHLDLDAVSGTRQHSSSVDHFQTLFRLVSYFSPIYLHTYYLLCTLQSCTDGLGSLPSVSACMGDKLSKVETKSPAGKYSSWHIFQLLTQLPFFQLTEKAPAQTKMPDPVVVSASAKHTVLIMIN